MGMPLLLQVLFGYLCNKKSSAVISSKFGGVFMLSRCFLDFVCGCRGFCHRTESDLVLFLSVVIS